MKPNKPDNCDTCGREVKLTFHHLVPKKLHKKRRTILRYPDVDLNHHGIWVCKDCHKKIHRLFSHDELSETYNTVEKLKEHETFAKFLKWVSKQDKRVK